MRTCIGLDATRIGPRLYQGSYPTRDVRPCGFDVVVLCAGELQHRRRESGVQVLRCPLNDDGSPMTRREWVLATRTAEQVAELVSHGRRVLVSCAMGKNRSGLVAALALYRLTPMSGYECVRHIRTLRKGALFNGYFVDALEDLPRRRGASLSHSA